MRKFTLVLFTGLLCVAATGQQRNFWSLVDESSIGRSLFINSPKPPVYKIFQLNDASFKSAMALAPSERVVAANRSTFIVSFPMPNGGVEQFRVVNAPVMDPALASRYPGINSYAGQGIEDPSSTIRFDVSRQGMNAIILSAKRPTIYIDQLDGNYYRIVSRKDIIDYPNHFRCLTDDIQNPSEGRTNRVEDADDGKLRTYRLAMLSGAEFSNHFIPAPLSTLADSIAAVLAAQNSHVTRSNAVYERDFGIRMVLVANNDLIIYFDPLTDPIVNPNNPSGTAVQNAITAAIGIGNYDIGHTESKGADNGNAGCIGCVCTDGQKGKGWTVYANPSLLEFFVIDYLTHEMGHQFGANHTFSFSLEGTGVNVEPGSGVTIMGYAGITGSPDVAPHSIELFSVKSIEQITDYIKTGGGSFCDVETITGNIAPIVSAGLDYTIPRSTPFLLTGTASDPNGDLLTYNWEQIDNRSGAFSTFPSPTATDGPMFRTYLSYPIPKRTFPELQYILTGANGFQWEVLPSVGRPLNFRFIAKDNRAGGGNNKTDDMMVTVDGTTGPFQVTAPNTAITWNSGATENVTWDVAGTTGAPVNCANVNILFSSDGGTTFSMLLANTPNDGAETVTSPSVATSSARIKIEAVGNIFFDISNTNFTVAPPSNSFDFNNPPPVVSACPAGASMAITLGTIQNGTFSTPIILTASGNPPLTTVSFSPNPVSPGSSTIVTLSNTGILAAGSYTITVTGTAGAIVRTRNITYTISAGTGPVITVQPMNQGVCVGGNTSFSIVAATATSFQWQVSTDGGGTYNNISNGGVYSGTTTATLNITGATAMLNNYRYRSIASTLCGSTNSNGGILTVSTAPVITTHPQSIILCTGSSHTFTVAATTTGLTYQWQSSPAGCTGPWTDIPTATSASYTLTGIIATQNNTGYRAVVTGSCAPAAISNCAVLTVLTSVAITTQPSDITVCEGSNTSFTVAGSGSGIVYQWQVSTNGGASYSNISNGGVYSGATTAILTITGTTFSMNNYRYRSQLSNATCTIPGVSNAAILTVNTLPAFTAQPASVTICVGANSSFTVAATGTGAGYQWQVSTDGGSNYNNVSNGGVYSGVTTATLTITGAMATMNNYLYRAVATGTCAPPANSNAATLTVISPVSISGAGQPAASIICSGSNTNFTVTGGSMQSIIYQWQVSTDGGSSYNNISNGGIYSGATTATLTITGATTSLNNNRYRSLLSNASCTVPTISSGALLTVRQLPTVTLTAAPLTSLLPGQTTTLTATPSASTGGTLSTTWFHNNNFITNTGNTRVINVDSVGNYQVTVQETFTGPSLVCSNQSAIVTITAAFSNKLFIFPTPNDGRFTVSYYNDGGVSTKRKISIFDSKGVMVYNREFSVVGPYTLLTIDLQTATRGIYFLVVGDASGGRLADGKVHIR